MNAAPVFPSQPSQGAPSGQLPTGLVAQAQVVSSPSRPGELALQIYGRTYEAVIPPSVQEGQQLTVKVLLHTELLHVKLLDTSAATALPNLNGLSSPQELQLLQLLQNLPARLPSRDEIRQLFEMLQSLSKGIDLGKLLDGSLDRGILLQGLASSGLISEGDLGSPDAIKNILRTVISGLQDREQPRNQVAGKLLEVLAHLRDAMSTTSNSGSAHDGTDSLSGALSKLASVVGGRQLIMQVENLLGQVALSKPVAINLSLQLQALALTLSEIGSRDLLQIPTNPQTVMHFAQQLADPKLPQVNIERIIQTLSNQLFGESFSAQGSTAAATRGDLARLQSSLESIGQTQELLQRLNSFMQQLQEPIMVLLPAALRDMFWMWQLRFDSVYENQDRDPGSGKKYHRFTLQLTLPSIGSIEVRCAHSGEEALVNLKFEDQERAEFADQLSHHLKILFQEIGINQSLVINRVGATGSINPVWLDSIAGTSLVA